jgi:hypothetical protein
LKKPREARTHALQSVKKGAEFLKQRRAETAGKSGGIP